MRNRRGESTAGIVAGVLTFVVFWLGYAAYYEFYKFKAVTSAPEAIGTINTELRGIRTELANTNMELRAIRDAIERKPITTVR